MQPVMRIIDYILTQAMAVFNNPKSLNPYYHGDILMPEEPVI